MSSEPHLPPRAAPGDASTIATGSSSVVMSAGRARGAVTKIACVASTAAVLANLFVSGDTNSQVSVYCISIAVSWGFVFIAVAGLPPAHRRRYRPACWSSLLWVGGAVVFGVYQSRWPQVFPSPADALLIVGYVPLAVAVWRLDSRGGRTFGLLLDAAIMAVSAGVLSFVFIMLPKLEQHDLSVSARLVGSIYPLMDVVLLFLVAKILITPGRSSPSLGWLSAALMSTTAADLLQNLIVMAGANTYPRWTYFLWSLFYVLLGLSALAAQTEGIQATPPPESLRAVSRDVQGPESENAGLTMARLTVLTITAALPAALIVLTVGTRKSNVDADLAYLGIGSILLMAMVSARIWNLLRILKWQAVQLSQVARTDPLTGVANRRSWDFELARSFAAQDAQRPVLVVGLLDLDHFKQYNDTHGHQAGDDLLREAARAWSLDVGPHGKIARWGGEEFAVAIHCPDAPTGLAHIDKLRASVPYAQTCSIGAAEWDGTESADTLLHRADVALYEAKQTGRNKTIMFNEERHVVT